MGMRKLLGRMSQIQFAGQKGIRHVGLDSSLLQDVYVLVGVEAGVGDHPLWRLAAGGCDQVHHGEERSIIVTALDNTLGDDEVIFRDRDRRRVAEHESLPGGHEARIRVGDGPLARLLQRFQASRHRGFGQSLGGDAQLCARPSLLSSASQAFCHLRTLLRSRARCCRCSITILSADAEALIRVASTATVPHCRRPSRRACSSTCVKQSLIATGCRRRNAFRAQSSGRAPPAR